MPDKSIKELSQVSVIVSAIVFGRQKSENKIFFPTYWIDAASRVKTNSFEAKLINNLIPIPIDQRYSILDLSNTIEIIKKYLCKK